VVQVDDFAVWKKNARVGKARKVGRRSQRGTGPAQDAAVSGDGSLEVV
jgi:hypothetical protein